MDGRPVVRVEIEYVDGEVRRAEGTDADIIWRNLMIFYENSLMRRRAVHDGPSLKTVRAAGGREVRSEDGGGRVDRISLADLARCEVTSGGAGTEGRVQDGGRGGEGVA